MLQNNTIICYKGHQRINLFFSNLVLYLTLAHLRKASGQLVLIISYNKDRLIFSLLATVESYAKHAQQCCLIIASNSIRVTNR